MFEQILQPLLQNPVADFFAEYPLLIAAAFIIIVAIIIKKILSRRSPGRAEGKARGSGEIPDMPPFRKPGEKKRSVLEEPLDRRQISLPRERLTIRSLKELEKAREEGLITEELYTKARRKLLED
jgi:hypothetical protein